MRLFFACLLPAPVSEDVARATASVRAAVDRVRWVPPVRMHLTMKFLGERPDHDVERIADEARTALSTIAPFKATIRGAGAFPNFSRPRVVWLGMHPAASFAAMAARLERALHPLGYPIDSRPFAAHLTLGRVYDVLAPAQRATLAGSLAGSLADALGDSLAGLREGWPLDVRELALVRSDLSRGPLSRGGPRYESLRTISLGAP